MACLWGAILIKLMDVIKDTPVSGIIFSAEDCELGKRGEWKRVAKVHSLLSVPDCGCDLTNAL